MVLLGCELPDLGYPPEEVALFTGLRLRWAGRIIWCLRDVVTVPNVHHDPDLAFAVRWGDTPANTVGAVHSHPPGDDNPSELDLELIPRHWIGAVVTDSGSLSWYTKNRPADPTVRRIGPGGPG